MRIVFFGTPYYVLPIVEALNKSFREVSNEGSVVAVVTQSPKPAGRKQQLQFSAVDEWAHKKGIPKFFNPMDIIKEGIDADVAVLASYGEMIPQQLINYFKYGILVIHPSLLPEFRWASPVPAAIVTGQQETGVSVIKMDNKWDHGPVVTTMKAEITPSDTYGTLRDRLFDKSAELVIQMLPAFIKGKIHPKPQDDKKASFARMITKEDSFIPPLYLESALKGKSAKGTWQIPFIKVNDRPYSVKPNATAIGLFVRAMDPSPIAWTQIKIGKTEQILRLKILKAHAKEDKLVLDQVQLEGKGPVGWEQFKEGHPEAKFS